MKGTLLLIGVLLHAVSGCSQSNGSDHVGIGGPCEDCELMFAGIPDQISWQSQISSPADNGEPMVIRGTIFQKDGKTPAQGVVLYVYHTDARGRYTPAAGQTIAKRHGHLRGWVKTGADGRYEFRSIRPASYPTRDAPQHIHPIVFEPGRGYYWIDEYLFDDDPLLTERDRSMQEKRGGSGIISLTKDSKGVWVGRRDIVLGLNVPLYR